MNYTLKNIFLLKKINLFPNSVKKNFSYALKTHIIISYQKRIKEVKSEHTACKNWFFNQSYV